MKGCFRCITDCFTPRSDQSFLFVNDTEEGIEFERLIELPEHILQTGAAPPVINERERHLISHRLYAEYCDDEEQHAVLKEQELLREEEQLAIEEEDYYNNKAKKVQDYYSGSDHKRSASLNNYVVFEDFPARYNSEVDVYNNADPCSSDCYDNVLCDELKNTDYLAVTDPVKEIVSSPVDCLVEEANVGNCLVKERRTISTLAGEVDSAVSPQSVDFFSSESAEAVAGSEAVAKPVEPVFEAEFLPLDPEEECLRSVIGNMSATEEESGARRVQFKDENVSSQGTFNPFSSFEEKELVDIVPENSNILSQDQSDRLLDDIDCLLDPVASAPLLPSEHTESTSTEMVSTTNSLFVSEDPSLDFTALLNETDLTPTADFLSTQGTFNPFSSFQIENLQDNFSGTDTSENVRSDTFDKIPGPPQIHSQSLVEDNLLIGQLTPDRSYTSPNLLSVLNDDDFNSVNSDNSFIKISNDEDSEGSGVKINNDSDCEDSGESFVLMSPQDSSG